MIIQFFSFIGLFIYFLVPQSDGPINQEIINKLVDYSWSHHQEKAYLHTDKSFYMPGDDIWFKAYLMQGPYHMPDTISSVLYVELINNGGFVIERKAIRIREGLGWGDFQLSRNIPPGRYILKAYTRYMQNYDAEFHYRKFISIISDQSTELLSTKSDTSGKNRKSRNTESKSVHLHFFPEGGNLVEGLRSKIAFKATDEMGIGIDVQGIIKDTHGDEIVKFESRKFGLGVFTLKPVEDEEYIAHINIGGEELRYELPKQLKEGYVMRLSQKGDNVYIWVNNNMGINMENSFVIGQFRGFPFITIHAEPGKNYLYSILNVKEIPSGIIQFTFFDPDGIPQCERLIFAENEQFQMKLDIKTDKSTYRKREKISFNLHCSDTMGNTPLTNLSLSITNAEIVKNNKNKSNIGSYFNLESDLKGNIEHPGYYFDRKNTDRIELMDNLMLTHGWRRFVWQEIIDDQVPKNKYMAESGFTIEGELSEFPDKKKDWIGYVGLYIFEGQFYYNEIETDQKGEFHFYGINIYDSTTVVMQGWREMKMKMKRAKKTTRKKHTLKLNTIPFSETYPELWPIMDWTKEEDPSDYFDLNEFIMRIDSSYDEKTIIMDELIVKDKKIDMDDPFYRSGKLHSTTIRRIVMDSIPDADQGLFLFSLVRKYYPNVSITGTYPNIQVSIRGRRSITGSNQALLLLDGQAVTSDFLYYFPVTEVEFVEVLSSAGAAIYGSRGVNGAIAVYTRTAPSTFIADKRDWVLNFVYPGYYRAREFYTPDYGTPEDKHIKPDFRKVLYWAPSLTTDEEGNIEFSFYTSDEEAEYRVEVEGMTYDGVPVIEEYYFSVE